jgi:ABC-2 type transport system permease protein
MSLIRRIARLLRIYLKLQLLHLRVALEYEADFWIIVAGSLLQNGAGFVFVWVLLSRIPQIGGWSLWEVAVLYALAIIPGGLVELFADGAWSLRRLVNTGELDRILVRPISPAMQVVTDSAGIHGVASILLGGYLLARAAHEIPIALTPGHLVFLLVTLLGGSLVIASIDFLTSSVVFWDHSQNSSFSFLVRNTGEFAKFPLTAYGPAVRALLTWVLPFAFVSYFPGAVLLGKPDVPTGLGYLSPVAGLVVAAVASVVWRLGLQRYQGTGH